jgi:8-oxo-dGTP pyrophosphatase MutT (NUDIX family)
MKYGDEAHVEVGWRPVPVNPRSYVNPRGWAVLWIIVTTRDAQGREYSYEQPTIIQNSGVYVVCRDRQGLVALQRERRLSTERLSEMKSAASYVRELLEKDLWGKLVETFGSWQWQLPRGLPDPRDGELFLKDTDVLLVAARRTAREEIGAHLDHAELLNARIIGNSTFDVHPQYVAVGERRSADEAAVKLDEHIRPVEWLSAEAIRSLIARGELRDASSVMALAAAGVL